MRQPVLAIFDASDDILRLLDEAFSEEGFAVVGAPLATLRGGRDLCAFLTHHDPKLVLLDVPTIYPDEILALYRQARAFGSRRRFLLMTTSAALLSRRLRPGEAPVVLSKPFDFGEAKRAMRRALERPGLDEPWIPALIAQIEAAR
jgi:DNA-binding response OmpR family regulator